MLQREKAATNNVLKRKVIPYAIEEAFINKLKTLKQDKFLSVSIQTSALHLLRFIIPFL